MIEEIKGSVSYEDVVDTDFIPGSDYCPKGNNMCD